VSTQDRRQVREFLAFLRESFQWRLKDFFFDTWETRLLRQAARLPFLHAEYSELFSRIQPKVVFLEDGCYGSRSFLIKWAKDQGIKTSEFQHGAIGATHHAYRYGAVGFDPAYAAYLPDFLLTHGRFWSDNALLPCKKITLGNPHFQANIDKANAGASTTAGEPTLLVVSQGNVTDRVVTLTLELARLSPGLKIVFRLHPAEVQFLERYRPLEGLPNVSISKSGDIYEQILSATWIAGVSSTTLYEATGLQKPVYVYDTPTARFYTPRNFGIWFSDASDLLQRIRGPQPPVEVVREHIWAPNWEENYRRFLEGEVGIRLSP
jgi:hypothetical protein